MKKDLEKQLKATAVSVRWAGIVLSLLLGVLLARGPGAAAILLGIAAAALGVIVSLALGLLLRGLGENLERTAALEARLREEKQEPSTLDRLLETGQITEEAYRRELESRKP